MRIRLRTILIGCLLLPLCLAGLAGLLSPAVAHSEEAVSFGLKVSKAAVLPGDELAVTVQGTGLADVYGYDLRLEFDAEQLELVDEEGLVSGFPVDPRINGGAITLIRLNIEKDKNDRSSLELHRLTFKVLADADPGQTRVSLNSATLVDSSGEGVTEWKQGTGAEVSVKRAPATDPNPPPETPVPTPEADVPDVPEVTEQADGSIVLKPAAKVDAAAGKASSTVTAEHWEAAVGQAKAGPDGRKRIRLELHAGKEASAYAIKLPAAALAGGGSDGTQLEIAAPFATLTTSSEMFQAGGLAANEVELNLALADISKLDEHTRSMIGGRPVIDLSVSAGGQTVEWSNPDAPVTISIPYAPTAEELEDPEHIVVWYVDGSGQVHAVASGRYDSARGSVVFATTHFSIYAVSNVKVSFGDLTAQEWARKPIEVLASKGILQGVSDDAFDPGQPVKRADFLVMLMRTLEVAGLAEASFSDVRPDDYFFEAVGLASKLGIADGIGDGRFEPTAMITRQDMMVLTERTLRLLDKVEFQGTEESLEDFDDRAELADYAVQSAANLVEAGLIHGDGESLEPEASTTRAEAAVLIYNMYNKVYK